MWSLIFDFQLINITSQKRVTKLVNIIGSTSNILSNLVCEKIRMIMRALGVNFITFHSFSCISKDE